MSGKTLNPVSAVTSKATAPNAVPIGASGGKVGPQAGKSLPAQQASPHALFSMNLWKA